MINPSFESPVVANGTFTNSATGWAIATTGSVSSAAGVYYPTSGAFSTPVPNGNQVLFIRGAANVSQTTAGTLGAAGHVTVSFYAGWRLDQTFNPLSALALDATNGDLLGDTTISAAQFTDGRGTFQQFNFSFLLTNNTLDHELTIEFVGMSTQGQVDIDSVVIYEDLPK